MPLHPDEHWMNVAIEAALRGIAAGQTPFGAAIVRGDELVIAAHNVVWQHTDITAHAEVHALRLACARSGSIDLSGCRIYSTCEPCPMCFSACQWARLDRIIYGARIADAKAAGFNELPISNEQLKHHGHSGVQLTADLLREQCRQLFEQWQASAGHRGY
jgi:tRNA(Arg) A34 adenosine deaminase TadA